MVNSEQTRKEDDNDRHKDNTKWKLPKYSHRKKNSQHGNSRAFYNDSTDHSEDENSSRYGIGKPMHIGNKKYKNRKQKERGSEGRKRSNKHRYDNERRNYGNEVPDNSAAQEQIRELQRKMRELNERVAQAISATEKDSANDKSKSITFILDTGANPSFIKSQGGLPSSATNLRKVQTSNRIFQSGRAVQVPMNTNKKTVKTEALVYGRLPKKTC